MLLVFPLAKVGPGFGPPEYFSIVFMGMTLSDLPGPGDRWLKAIAMILFGLILSTRRHGHDLRDSSVSPSDRTRFRTASGWCPWSWVFSGSAEVLTNLEERCKQIEPC